VRLFKSSMRRSPHLSKPKRSEFSKMWRTYHSVATPTMPNTSIDFYQVAMVKSRFKHR
jgi:hypothetical protein